VPLRGELVFQYFGVSVVEFTLPLATDLPKHRFHGSAANRDTDRPAHPYILRLQLT